MVGNVQVEAARPEVSHVQDKGTELLGVRFTRFRQHSPYYIPPDYPPTPAKGFYDMPPNFNLGHVPKHGHCPAMGPECENPDHDYMVRKCIDCEEQCHTFCGVTVEGRGFTCKGCLDLDQAIRKSNCDDVPPWDTPNDTSPFRWTSEKDELYRQHLKLEYPGVEYPAIKRSDIFDSDPDFNDDHIGDGGGKPFWEIDRMYAEQAQQAADSFESTTQPPGEDVDYEAEDEEEDDDLDVSLTKEGQTNPRRVTLEGPPVPPPVAAMRPLQVRPFD